MWIFALPPAVLLVLCVRAPSQHTQPLPLLRTPEVVSPWQAFQHLRAGNVAVQRTPRGKTTAPRRRPYGPGRRIAAVAVPSGLSWTAAELLAVHHRDLLVFAAPGPVLRVEETAAIEHGVEHEQVSLLVILVDPADPVFAATGEKPTRAGRSLRRHADAARRLAKENRISVPAAHGILQAEGIWRRSEFLEKKRLQGRFQIAIGVIDTKSRAIHWVTKWHKRWQLVTSASAAEVMELQKLKRARAAQKALHDKSKAKASDHGHGRHSDGNPRKHE